MRTCVNFVGKENQKDFLYHSKSETVYSEKYCNYYKTGDKLSLQRFFFTLLLRALQNGNVLRSHLALSLPFKAQHRYPVVGFLVRGHSNSDLPLIKVLASIFKLVLHLIP